MALQKTLALSITSLMMIAFAPNAQAADDKIIVFSDSHIDGYGNDEMKSLQNLIGDINKQRGDFDGVDLVICTGDCVDDQSDGNLAIFKTVMDKLNVPWYAVPGNHDMKVGGESSIPCITDSESVMAAREATWVNQTGQPVYARVDAQGNTLWKYYLVNTYRGCWNSDNHYDDVGTTQGDWLYSNVQTDYNNGKKMVFFQHYAPEDAGGICYWGNQRADDDKYEDVLGDFSDRIEFIFNGHGHARFCSDKIEGGDIRLRMTPSLEYDKVPDCSQPVWRVKLQEDGGMDTDQECDQGGNSDDSDDDGFSDDLDNCINVANGPLDPDAGGYSQRDTDGDGCGNICDPDLNSNGFTDSSDFATFEKCYQESSTDPDCDLNGNGITDSQDVAIGKHYFDNLLPPGPSGMSASCRKDRVNPVQFLPTILELILEF